MKAFKKQTISSALVAAVASAGILAGFLSQAAAQSSEPNLHTPDEIRWVKGRILVQPRAGLSPQELDKRLNAHGGRRVGAIQQLNVHIVELPSQANERAVAQMLRADRHLKFAELDEHVPSALTPNDPYYTKAWHHPKIGSPNAWDYAVGGGVTIAILDSGADPSHPDLVSNLVPGYNFYHNNNDTRDMRGHGTRVSGTAAMAGNNLIGGAGVSYQSKIMPIRVSDDNGYASFSTIAKGLVWAADRGARVASISFSRVCGSSTIWSAAQYLRNKGGVVTGAAGNSGSAESLMPSATITCVSATDSADNKTSWSSYGSYVDVAAPGAGIYTTNLGGGYSSVSGTSFSAPMTAGVYALMLSANRALSPAQLDSILFSTAVDRGTDGKDNYYGYGRIDAAAAVEKARGTSGGDTTAPSVSITSPAANSNVAGLVPVSVNASDNLGVARVDLYAGGKLLGSDTTVPYGFSWDTAGLPDGQTTLEARAVDAAGNFGSAKVTVTVANDTLAPSVSIVNPQPGAVITSPITISASATDDKRVAKISLAINGKEVALTYGSTVSYAWDPYGGTSKGQGKGNKKTSGSNSITATATDDAGNSRSLSVSVTVQ
jgi:thermitase